MSFFELLTQNPPTGGAETYGNKKLKQDWKFLSAPVFNFIEVAFSAIDAMGRFFFENGFAEDLMELPESSSEKSKADRELNQLLGKLTGKKLNADWHFAIQDVCSIIRKQKEAKKNKGGKDKKAAQKRAEEERKKALLLNVKPKRPPKKKKVAAITQSLRHFVAQELLSRNQTLDTGPEVAEGPAISSVNIGPLVTVATEIMTESPPAPTKKVELVTNNQPEVNFAEKVTTIDEESAQAARAA